MWVLCAGWNLILYFSVSMILEMILKKSDIRGTFISIESQIKDNNLNQNKLIESEENESFVCRGILAFNRLWLRKSH